MDATANSSRGEEPPSFVAQLRALANNASLDIIKILSRHRSSPVPVRAIAEELGAKRSTASKYIARLRKVNLVGIQDRHRGYSLNTAEIKAVVGLDNYRRITQDLSAARNEDTPGNLI